MVGDDELGGHLGEAAAGVLDRLLGVAEERVVVGRLVAIVGAARVTSAASWGVESSGT